MSETPQPYNKADIPTNVLKFFDEIQTNSNNHAYQSKDYFFKLHDISRDTKCIENEVIDDSNGNKWIRMSFRNLTLFGDDDQKRKFHEYRKKYIDNLVASLCVHDNNCNFEVIGSDSPVSDRDIFVFEIMGFKKNGVDVNGKIGEVINSIKNEHYKYHNLSLEEMFDCNLYMTNFFGYTDDVKKVPKGYSFYKNKYNEKYLCVNIQKYDNKQRKFSVRRLLVSLQCVNNSKQNDITQTKDIIKSQFIKYFNLLNYCDSKLFSTENLSLNTRGIRKSLCETVRRRTINVSTCPIERTNKVSELSATEKDAYHTLGAALLHVVDTSQYSVDILSKLDISISIPLYIDAILDNLGFVAATLLEDDACKSELYTEIKATKYIDRICNSFIALNNLNPTTLDEYQFKMLKEVSNASYSINSYRKLMYHEDSVEMTSSMNAMKKTLDTFFDSINNTNCAKRSSLLPKIVIFVLFFVDKFDRFVNYKEFEQTMPFQLTRFALNTQIEEKDYCRLPPITQVKEKDDYRFPPITKIEENDDYRFPPITQVKEKDDYKFPPITQIKEKDDFRFPPIKGGSKAKRQPKKKIVKT